MMHWVVVVVQVSAVAVLAKGMNIRTQPRQHGSPWPPNARSEAEQMLMKMNLTEKVDMLHGWLSGGYGGSVIANTRLGIPRLNLEDGPQGVGDGLTQVTAFPSAMTVAGSWDRDLVFAFGAAMGREQYLKGTNVMLGPGINLARVPWNGRNYEYLGEDPYLASMLAASIVAGVQTNNITATIKHFMGNDQEFNRGGMSANIPQRAAMELYYAAFQGAVDVGVGAVMLGTNAVNDTKVYNNSNVIDHLKNAMGFAGWVMTDWDGPTGVENAMAGLDQGMPGTGGPSKCPFWDPLKEAVQHGTVPLQRLDDMVLRILTPMYALGLMGDPPIPDRNISSNARSPAHDKLARRLSEESIVLLQNRGSALPLNMSSLRSILVVGDRDTVVNPPPNSGCVQTPYIVSPFTGFLQFIAKQSPPWLYDAGDEAYVRAMNGTVAGGSLLGLVSNLKAELQAVKLSSRSLHKNKINHHYDPSRVTSKNQEHASCTLYHDIDFFQDGAPCVTVGSMADCCSSCSETQGCLAWTFVPGATCPGQPHPQPAGQCFLKAGADGFRAHPGLISGTIATPPVVISYIEGSNFTELSLRAASVDAVVVVVATVSHEGEDRSNLSLPAEADEMVFTAADANPRTIVVTRCPGACLMPWRDQVPAILAQSMGGQEAGSALASVIFGEVNPSGKLPLSFPSSESDTWLGDPLNPGQYPGVKGPSGWQDATYAEELLIGYRWYDAKRRDPLWPFGHGLSYTTFQYTNLSVSGALSPSTPTINMTFALRNVGFVTGAEAVQLYLSYPEAALEPPRVLKGFQKIQLLPAQVELVKLTLCMEDASIWDTRQGTWIVMPGEYLVSIGSSSRDIRLTAPLKIFV